MFRFVVATCSLIMFTACAGTGIHGVPRKLMRQEIDPTWEDHHTGESSWHDHSCESLQSLVAHATGRHVVTFMLNVVGRSAKLGVFPLPRYTVWFREPFFEDVLQIDVTDNAYVSTHWSAVGDEPDRTVATRSGNVAIPVSLKLKVSVYPRCVDGELVESVGTYSQAGLIVADGCSDAVFLVDRNWVGDKTIELACGGRSPNSSMNLSFRPVTAVARATASPGRPAGYAER